MKQLEIKHLAPYLPYGLKVWHTSNEAVYPLVVRNITISLRGGLNIDEVIEDNFKPILYPLDYLTKEITHNGETFVPVEKINEFAPLGDYFGFAIEVDELGQLGLRTPESWLNPILTYNFINKLIEWRFDIFNLINDGLAIPVTEDFNPYK